MRVKIELEVELPDGSSVQELKYLLKDAFYEFEGHRRDDYVTKRYPNLNGRRREQKQIEVDRRRVLARSLHRAVDEVMMSEVEMFEWQELEPPVHNRFTDLLPIEVSGPALQKALKEGK